MNDDEIVKLIEELSTQLDQIGAFDLADERNYLRDAEEGEDDRHLLPPRERLISMLLAFERLLKLNHRGTYDTAMSILRETLRDDFPRAASLMIPGAERPQEIALDNLPDLREPIASIERVIGALREDVGPEPEASR